MVSSTEFMGYPIAPAQAEFYLLILTVIAASMALVGSAYLYFWLADEKKRRARLENLFSSRTGVLVTLLKYVLRG